MTDRIDAEAIRKKTYKPRSKAEDTVLNLEKMDEFVEKFGWILDTNEVAKRVDLKYQFLEVAKAQAKATWDIAIQEGRKEVVEWLRGKEAWLNNTKAFQAKLKEWGLSDAD